MRRTKTRRVGRIPPVREFRPVGGAEPNATAGSFTAVTIGLDMLEAMRLVDALGLSHEEASQHMGVSPATLCRILGAGRRGAALALTEGVRILLDGGQICMEAGEREDAADHSRPGAHGRCRRGLGRGPFGEASDAEGAQGS